MLRFTLFTFASVCLVTPMLAAQDAVPLRATGTGHTQRIYRGVFTPDSKIFLTAGIDKIIRAWNTETGKEMYQLEGHAGSIHAIGLAGEKLLVSAGEDGTILLWDLAQRKRVGQLAKHQEAIHCLAVSKDGKFLATAGGSWKESLPGELRVWDLVKKEEIMSLEGHRRLILAVSFSPDGRSLAAVDYSGDIKVWNLATRKRVTVQLDQPPSSALFSPDGKQLAVGSFNGKLRLYSAATLAEEAVIDAHQGGVLFMGFAPRGHILASAGWDGAIRLWHPQDIEERPGVYVGQHKDKAWMVAFSPDGKTLGTTGEDRLVKFWSITPELDKRFEPATKKPAPEKIVERTQAAKVALLTSHDVEESRNVQDLVLAKLSNDKKIHLLDRTAVDRVLREQKLSLSGLVDATTAVRAGKVLAVDLLAIVEYSPEAKKNTSLVVFDTATGVKLLDAGLTESALDAQTQQVMAGVRSATEKWRAGMKNLKTVCFMPVRNADLPRSMDRFCEILGASLERELLGGGSVALLERKRLALVNKEKELVLEAATRELLASLTVVEMNVSRGKDGKGLRAAVVLRDNAGKELHRIAEEVDDPNGTGLLAALAEKMRAALKTTAPEAVASRSRESRRFHQEATLLWKHKHYLQGLQAAEAAYALKPSDETRHLLTEYLICYATDLLHPGGMRTMVWGSAFKFEVAPDKAREALDHARRGLQLIDTARSALPNKNDEKALRMKIEPFAVTDAQRFFFNKLTYLHVVPAQADVQQEYDEFRQFCVQRIVLRCFDALEPADDPHALDRYTRAIEKSVENIGRLAPNQDANVRTLHQLALKWLERTKDAKPQDVSVYQATTFVGFLGKIYESLLPVGPLKLALPLDALELGRKHPHPLVRHYASHVHLRAQVRLDKLAKEDGMAQHRRLIDEAKRLIEKPPVEPHDQFRVSMYRLVDHAIYASYVYGQNGPGVVGQYLDLCDFMLANNDVVEEVVQHAVTYGAKERELNVRALRIIDGALQLADSPRRRHFADSPERFRMQMKPIRHQVLTRLPDLLKLTLPWESARPLVEAVKLQSTLIVTACLHEKQVYFFTGGPDSTGKQWELRLYRCEPTEADPKLLGRTQVAAETPVDSRKAHHFWIDPGFFVTSMAFTKDHLYAGTVREGILVFPLAGGPPVRIGEKEGLPSAYVDKVAIVGNTLFAGLSGGYLVTLDLTTKRVETLASGRRSDKKSPFDNGPPFTVTQLAADPERQRVLFNVTTFNTYTLTDPNAGLWEYDFRKQQFQKLKPHIWGAWSPVRDGRIYLHLPESLLAYDLAANEFTLLSGKAPKEYGKVKSAFLPADFSMPFGRALWHRDHVWESYPFARHSQDRKETVFLPTPRDNSWTYSFSSNVILQAISPDELLVGNYQAIYYLRLKAK